MRDEILIRQDKKINDILKDARVSIMGCGGLGSNIAMMLARSGVGNLFIYDFDKVEMSNLNRQNYEIADIGKSKVFETKRKIENALPHIKVYAKEVFIDKTTIGDISQKSDIFVEAFDNRKSKVFVFDYFSQKKGKFLLTASGLSGLGNLSDIRVKKIDNVTLVGDFKSKVESGLYMPYISAIASIEALETLKIIIGDLYGK